MTVITVSFPTRFNTITPPDRLKCTCGNCILNKWSRFLLQCDSSSVPSIRSTDYFAKNVSSDVPLEMDSSLINSYVSDFIE